MGIKISLLVLRELIREFSLTRGCAGGAYATLGPGTEDSSAQLHQVGPRPHGREQAQVHVLQRQADIKQEGLSQV